MRSACLTHPQYFVNAELAQGLPTDVPTISNTSPAAVGAGLTPAQLLFGGGNGTGLRDMLSPLAVAIQNYRSAAAQLGALQQLPPVLPPGV